MSYDVSRTLATIGMGGTVMSFIFTVQALMVAADDPTVLNFGASIVGALFTGGFGRFTQICLEVRREAEGDEE